MRTMPITRRDAFSEEQILLENRLISVVLEVSSKGASDERAAELVIEMQEIKAKKITLESQPAEQRVAAYHALKQEVHDAELERRREQRDEWEVQYAEFENYDGMPETTSTLHNGKRTS